jgi:hypothetical protein
VLAPQVVLTCRGGPVRLSDLQGAEKSGQTAEGDRRLRGGELVSDGLRVVGELKSAPDPVIAAVVSPEAARLVPRCATGARRRSSRGR